MAETLDSHDFHNEDSLPRKRFRKTREGLTTKQVVFLQVLSEAKGPLNKETLCDRTKSHPTNVFLNAVGSCDPNIRANRETKTKYPSLITLGYIRYYQLAIEGNQETVFEITSEGLRVLTNANNE